eukprot:8846621-Pyramimonas_sp.AAC.1
MDPRPGDPQAGPRGSRAQILNISTTRSLRSTKSSILKETRILVNLGLTGTRAIRKRQNDRTKRSKCSLPEKRRPLVFTAL